MDLFPFPTHMPAFHKATKALFVATKMQFHWTEEFGFTHGGYEMKTAIIVYCVLAATFLFILSLRAEMVQEFKPQESTKPVVVAKGNQSGIRRSAPL